MVREDKKRGQVLKFYRLAVCAITQEQLLAGVVAISVVQGEHYRVMHKTQKHHQSQIVRTAQDGPEKRKRKVLLDNLFTRYSSFMISSLTRIGDSLSLFGGAIGFNHSQDLQIILVAALLNFWRKV